MSRTLWLRVPPTHSVTSSRHWSDPSTVFLPGSASGWRHHHDGKDGAGGASGRESQPELLRAGGHRAGDLHLAAGRAGAGLGAHPVPGYCGASTRWDLPVPGHQPPRHPPHLPGTQPGSGPLGDTAETGRAAAGHRWGLCSSSPCPGPAWVSSPRGSRLTWACPCSVLSHGRGAQRVPPAPACGHCCHGLVPPAPVPCRWVTHSRELGTRSVCGPRWGKSPTHGLGGGQWGCTLHPSSWLGLSPQRLWLGVLGGS